MVLLRYCWDLQILYWQLFKHFNPLSIPFINCSSILLPSTLNSFTFNANFLHTIFISDLHCSTYTIISQCNINYRFTKPKNGNSVITKRIDIFIYGITTNISYCYFFFFPNKLPSTHNPNDTISILAKVN